MVSTTKRMPSRHPVARMRFIPMMRKSLLSRLGGGRTGYSHEETRMLRRGVAALVVALAVVGLVVADETVGRVTKVEDDSITIQTFGKKKGDKGEEKTFKVSKNTKVTKTAGKDKDPVKLSME